MFKTKLKFEDNMASWCTYDEMFGFAWCILHCTLTQGNGFGMHPKDVFYIIWIMDIYKKKMWIKNTPIWFVAWWKRCK
jgi:hypothetical protein